MMLATESSAPRYDRRTLMKRLAAAGFATALYSTFCTEDTALFYAVWYAVGIGFVALAGAFAGKRFLSW